MLHHVVWTVNGRFGMESKPDAQAFTTSCCAGAVTPAARSAELQASALRQTRREHSTETAEDYAEAIAELNASVGEARAVDLARRLGSRTSP